MTSAASKGVIGLGIVSSGKWNVAVQNPELTDNISLLILIMNLFFGEQAHCNRYPLPRYDHDSIRQKSALNHYLTAYP
jgi:hypothetical protein